MKVVQQEVGAVRRREEDLWSDECAAAYLLQRVRLGRIVERHHRADVRMRFFVALAVGDRERGTGGDQRGNGRNRDDQCLRQEKPPSRVFASAIVGEA
jgi:hypothetical protein